MCDKTSAELWEELAWVENWQIKIKIADQRFLETKLNYEQAKNDPFISTEREEYFRKERDFALDAITSLHEQRQSRFAESQ
jgi:hypothetical protein